MSRKVEGHMVQQPMEEMPLEEGIERQLGNSGIPESPYYYQVVSELAREAMTPQEAFNAILETRKNEKLDT